MLLYLIETPFPRTSSWTPYVQRLVELEQTDDGNYLYLIGVTNPATLDVLPDRDLNLRTELLGETFPEVIEVPEVSEMSEGFEAF